jgi:hypothetical protein
MEWTVSVTKTQIDTSPILQLTYTDGTRTIVDNQDIQGEMTDDDVCAMAAKKVAWLNAQDASANAITEGPIDPALLVIPPPVVPPPVVPDAALTQCRQDWQHLQTLNKLVAAGVLSPSNPTLVNLIATLKANFQVSYLDSIS